MSDLLNQASLVYIPSGYKEDTAYSVIPTDGSGDLTFSRASDGTRVNSQGLVERVPWNLARYSEDLSNAVWTKLAATITTNATTAPNGTTTADKVVEDTSANILHRVGQGSIAVTSGTKYTFSFYAKAAERFILELQRINTSGTVFNAITLTTVNLTNGTISAGSNIDASSITSVGNGWFRISLTLTAIATGSGGLNIGLCDANGAYVYTGDGVSGAYIWGFQANEGTLKPYFPTTDRQNVPRLDYTNGCPSLLLEPQRTNLSTYSEDFTNAFYAKFQSSITANTTTSPDGTTNADKLIADATNEKHGFYSEIVSPSAGICTQSAFFKAGEYNFACIRLSTDNDTKRYSVVLNLTTGAITSTDSSGSPTNTSYKVDNLGNGWFRLSVSAQHTSGNAYPTYAISSTASPTWDSSLPLFTGNGTSGIYVWGAQFEVGSYPTSYIPTTSASVTRVADAASKTGISSLIGQSEGVLFVDIAALVGANEDRQISINDGSTSNRVTMAFLSNGTQIAFVVQSGGSIVMNSTQTIAGLTTRVKIAYAYKLNDFAVYANGSLLATETSGAVPISPSVLSFDAGNNTDKFFGKVNELVLFPTRLTNAELAALTTL